jgi:hypothetical protein
VTVLLDAWDLFFAFRGVGWNWSRGLHLPLIPPGSRYAAKRGPFLVRTFGALIFCVIAIDSLLYFVQWFDPSTIGSTKGGSIFDPDLPPFLRYSRSWMLSLIGAMMVYVMIRIGYDFCSVIGVGVIQQDVVHYPPLFDNPWIPTSIHQFWSRGWHQILRDSFINLGAVPMIHMTGSRAAGVLGAFFISGILHDAATRNMGKGSDSLYICGFFMMNGVGILLEQAWRKFTGYRVGGMLGGIWSYIWIISWNQLFVDAWARTGVFGSIIIPPQIRPSVLLFGPLS